MSSSQQNQQQGCGGGTAANTTTNNTNNNSNSNSSKKGGSGGSSVVNTPAQTPNLPNGQAITHTTPPPNNNAPKYGKYMCKRKNNREVVFYYVSYQLSEVLMIKFQGIQLLFLVLNNNCFK